MAEATKETPPQAAAHTAIASITAALLGAFLSARATYAARDIQERRVRRAKLNETIEEVGEACLTDYVSIVNPSFSNRLVGSRVMIRSKGRLFPVLLAPDTPNEHMREVNQRIFRETGWPP